jgi:hypothetical protein
MISHIAPMETQKQKKIATAAWPGVCTTTVNNQSSAGVQTNILLNFASKRYLQE